MYEFLTFAATLLSGYFLVRAVRASGLVDNVLVFFCVSAAQIVSWGYMLSAANRLNDVKYWSIAGVTTALAAFLLFIVKRDAGQSPVLPSTGGISRAITSARNRYTKEISQWEKLLLTPLILTALLLGVINLMTIVLCAPHNVDSMTYHLARVAYYLQHGNLNYFPAEQWAQVVHPKNSTLLFLYSYVVSGWNENMTQMVQFISYWVSICGVYGIARKTGNSRAQGIFAALVSALLVEWLLESTTTQNDMVITAFFAAAINFLLAFRETRQRKYLFLTALGIGLAVGTKGTALLVLPALFLFASYILFQTDLLRNRLRNAAYFSAAFFLAIVIFALPSGYAENYIKFNNPMGPKQLMRQSFEGKSIGYIAQNGAKNILRYGFDFLALDGMPPLDVVHRAQSLLRAVPLVFIDSLGLDLEASEGADKPFRYEKPYYAFANEDWNCWGIFGFGLIWIVVSLSALGVVKSADARVLSWCAIIFFLTQAFSGMYQPFQCRYFMTCAVFAAPPIGVVLQADNKLIRSYILLIVLIGCLSAVSTVMLRPNRTPIPVNYKDIHRVSVFSLERTAQLTTNNRNIYPAVKAYDTMVPKDATVALCLNDPNSEPFEYPLFGQHLTRTIVPVCTFRDGVLPIPSTAGYLLYSQKELNCAAPEDIHLGTDWCLRRLTENNRKWL